ncbi:hypothetical protein PVAG01_01254 [Phlyctema vagabunda]|uniref:Zn(2)-C6 fungal-type domain-containing protein n=1 Tax=Phlyctema vagabunda TaxID=108571 RepID=A0ABR4PWZ6_9HELO
MRKMRVKTGCITCKARRVKCDETRPECRRCVKFWGACDGYGPVNETAVQSTSKTPLVQKSNNTTCSSLQRRILQPLSPWHFRDNQQQQYFGVFRDETVLSLPGIFTSSLWDRVILQACDDEAFVREAAIAIGALSVWKRRETSGDVSREPYEYALQQYGRALRSMRKALINAETHLRKTLIGCLLVICFEAMQGNYFLAMMQALSGLNILEDWKMRKRKKSRKELEGIISPAPNIVEDDLVQAFAGIDLQIINYVDPRPDETHEILKDEGTETINNMPDSFSSLEETRLYWVLIQRRCCHFIVMAGWKTSAITTPNSENEVDQEQRADYHDYHAEYIAKPLPQQAHINAECVRYAREISQWTLSFRPYYTSLEEGSKEWIAASVLKIHAQTTNVELLSAQFHTETAFDVFLPEYRSIIALVQQVVPLLPHIPFTLDLGVVNVLRLVGKWCREPQLRREVIKLLRACNALEGFQNAAFYADAIEWMMEIEELGIDEHGFVPESERVAIQTADIDHSGRKAVIACRKLGQIGCWERGFSW